MSFSPFAFSALLELRLEFGDGHVRLRQGTLDSVGVELVLLIYEGTLAFTLPYGVLIWWPAKKETNIAGAQVRKLSINSHKSRGHKLLRVNFYLFVISVR